MLLLKEKEINEVENESTVVSKKRIMPSRASYYSNAVESKSLPAQKEEYTIEFIRGGKSPSDVSVIESDLDINSSSLTEADLRQYENLSPDLMPSGATMRALNVKHYEEEDESLDAAVDFRVNKKGLLMLMIYAAIIIGIFTFIIFNAVSLVRLMNSTGALEQQIAQGAQNLENINERIDQVSDPDRLRDIAINDLNMVEPDASGTIHIEAEAPQAENEISGGGNLFDTITDAISGGGV